MHRTYSDEVAAVLTHLHERPRSNHGVASRRRSGEHNGGCHECLEAFDFCDGPLKRRDIALIALRFDEEGPQGFKDIGAQLVSAIQECSPPS